MAQGLQDQGSLSTELRRLTIHRGASEDSDDRNEKDRREALVSRLFSVIEIIDVELTARVTPKTVPRAAI